ncbi:MAG: hypothetical protein AAGD10_00090 [Myxococcota bacterium]
MASATEIIRDELDQLRGARKSALGVYVALLSMFLVGMQVFAYPVTGVMDVTALCLFLLGAAFSAGLTMGLPLLHGRALTGAIGLSLSMMGIGLLLIMNSSEPVYWGHGAKCFAVGTGFSAVAMITLGAVSGRLWRRFPDPGLLLALSTTFVGVMALHMNCAARNPIHIVVFHVGPLIVLYFCARGLVRVRDNID